MGITKETTQDQTVYDPTCGSGSLLLKAADEAGNGLSIYGQEKDVATTALCRMNMILHNNADAEIAPGNSSTLADPEFKQDNRALKRFDFAVAKPPFSSKNWMNGFLPKEDNYARFEYGIPPEKNGDYAFLLHILKSLKSTGKGAVILPHGVLFRGGAEGTIRRNLIKQGYIKGIIGLPANLFYGTGIPACIIVIDKAGAKARLENAQSACGGRASDSIKSGIFMIDASKGFMKDGPKNRLRDQDLHQIVDVFNHQIEQPAYSRMVSFDEIEGNDYNLNIPRYIDSSAAEDLHDLSAHLSGGIPNADIEALDNYWQVFPSLRKTLFAPLNDGKRQGYSQALVKAAEVKNTILEHREFKQFAELGIAIFHQWKAQAQLADLNQDDLPKAVIHRISENLLAAYTQASLLDRYDMYQIIMDYWAETMQDDIYYITQDGWSAANSIRELVVKKGEKQKEAPDLVINKAKYKAEVIPPALIVKRFFAEQQAQLDIQQTTVDTSTQALEAFIEEHAIEGGLLEEATNDSDKVNKASVAARLKAATDQQEIDALKQAKGLLEAEAAHKKTVKDTQAALDKKVLAQYPKLTEEEIKTLIVEDKWLATLQANIIAEIERVTQQLANRVKTLEERYAEPLPALTQSVAVLSANVDAHLKKMGLQW
ncbi:MAG: type I restriction enzyme M protein [Arenicella sp.]